jgi:hypothetical protein
MSQQIQITGGAKVRNLQDVIIGTSGVLSSVAFDVANGVPRLDVNGKILVSQLPNSVMEYKGTWSAATNTPTLVNGTGNQGDVYLCNVAGTVDFGAGAIAFVVGDQVIYSGSIWQRASGATGTVTSVAVTESGDSLNITGSPITTSGTINIGFNGTNLQYVNGAGNLTTFPILTGYVPYTGATANVDLGTFNLTADVITGATGSFTSNGGSDTFAINHSSGAGIALNITKGGSGEGLYINKTSGSGNAATIIGTLNATTLVKSGGTSSQYLMADGSTSTLTNPVTGTGTTNTLPKFTAASTIGNSNITDTGSLITLGSNTTISNGALGIGSSTLTGYALRASKSITGAVTGYGIALDTQIQSDVTTQVWGFMSKLSTAAASFTIGGGIRHFFVNGFSLGAGSTIGNQFGFYASLGTAGSTNYGFYGDGAAASNVWNIYMAGTANNYMAGSLGIGTTSLTGVNLRVGKTITGSTLSYGIYCDTIVQSDVTSAAIYYGTRASTAAASFTLGSITHYNIDQLAFGAGSTVTNQIGFLVNSSMTGATNNYGFYGNIASGTNRWNIYMAGTAANYLAGVLNIGTTTLSGYTLDVNGTARVQGAITGTVALTSVAGSGVGNDFTTNHTVNTSASYIGTRFLSNVTTSAANTSTIIAQQANIKITSTTNLPSAIQGCQLSMDMNGASGTLGQITGITSGGVVANGATVSNVYHYQTLGMFTPSTGVVNNQYGFYYDEAYVTPSNRGYAFYSKVNPSGGTLASLTDISIIPASTKGVGISNAAITPAASAILDITSTTKGVLFPRMTLAQRTAIASPATGLIVYQTDGVEGLWLNTSTGWRELTVV